MATLVVYSDANDGFYESISYNEGYAVARAGTGAGYVHSLDTYASVGQSYNDADDPDFFWYVWESFLKFDTSGIGSGSIVSSAILRVTSEADWTITSDFTIEVRPKDWGTAIEAADFIPGASLSGYTLLASYPTSSGFVATTGYDLTSESAFASNINKTGTTYLNLSSSRTRLNNGPVGDEYVNIYSADYSGTTSDPKLTITYDAASVDNRNASVVATGGGVVVVDDLGGYLSYTLPITGGGVAAVSGAKSAAQSVATTGGGVVVITRLAARTSSVVATASGVAVVSGRKSVAASVAATASGVAVVDGLKTQAVSIVATGGGVAAASVRKGGQSAVVATGAGVAVVDYVRTGGGNDKVVSVVATGGGVAVIDARHAGTVSANATGAGSALVSISTQRAVAVAATGAGTASPSVLAARAFAAAMTGGGVAVVDQQKGGDASVAATGGGVVVIVYTRSGNHKSVSVVATGGGIVGLDVLPGRLVAPTMTGGGVVVVAVPGPSVSVVATGGGVFTKGATPLPEIESPIGMSIDSGPVGIAVASDVVAIVSITTDSPILNVAETSILP